MHAGEVRLVCETNRSPIRSFGGPALKCIWEGLSNTEQKKHNYDYLYKRLRWARDASESAFRQRLGPILPLGVVRFNS